MTGLLPVSVIIPVRNEERMLPECLARLRRFPEVIVVDSGSTDRTAEIARGAGTTVLDFKWNGLFPKKRNWVLMNHAISNPWVLFLDADELLTDEFCDALDGAIRSQRCVGYWLNYTNYFLGRPLRHGVAQRKLAVFKVGAGLYERIDEDRWSNLDMEVHEHPIIDGPVGEIKARIDHRDDRGVLRFIDRHRDYAQWEAKRVLALESAQPGSPVKLTPRQRLKYRSLRRWWFPWFYFLVQYIFKFGVFDGHAGLQYALYKFWYFATVRLLLLENDVPARRAGRS
ncbi:MAG: glycosyltransferase family 2 protein [Hyphomonadaceae bacterium]|nr:glycosyltransferase family 2 protein [Hyphomonadaceae bacterium]MBY0565142.1 glycosyltransferase family 2 protein [Hyphomonadaceae bacterium]